MKNILTIAGSTSSTSINRQLAAYAATKIENAKVTELVINDLNLPLYSSDYEEKSGIPIGAKNFIKQVQQCDYIIISLAEHNGSYTAAFKNAYDWASRVEYEVWANKPMLLMATSPGKRGGKAVLETASLTFPRMGAELRSTFSLASFYDAFQNQNIIDLELETQLNNAVEKLISSQ